MAPYLYGNLVLFVPRAGTFAIIILIYVRLYIFFRQQASSHHKQESGIHEASFHVPLPTPASEMQIQFPDESSTETGGDMGRPSESTIASTRSLSALVKASSRQQQQSVDESTAILRSKLAQYQFARGVPRNESEDSALTVRSFRQPGWLGGGRRKETSGGNWAMSSEASPATASEKVANQGGSQPVKRASAVLQDSAEILNSSQGFEEQLVLLGQDGAVRGVVPREMPLQSPPEENASLLSGSTSVTPATERDEKLLSTSTLPPHSPLRGIVPMHDGISPGSESLLTLSSQNQVQVSNGFPGLSMPSAAAKQQQGENTIMGLWEALASVDPVDSDDAGLVEACAEKGRRLSASEENRRVSYLMLLYPLAVSSLGS